MVFVDGIKTSGVVKLLLCIQVTRSIGLVLVFFQMRREKMRATERRGKAAGHCKEVGP